MNLEATLKSTVKSIIKEIFDQEVVDGQIQFQKTKKEYEGDLTLLIFPFTKLLRKPPVEIGNEIGQLLTERLDEISNFNTVGGFLNIAISDRVWVNMLSDISGAKNYGIEENTGNRLMVEYSSPNTNKPLHLGHLRNNFLGHSVARILEANGNAVVKTQIINDRGIHICKSMLAWKRFGNNETPESSGIKGDKLVGKYYVVFDKELKEQTGQVISNWENGSFESDDPKDEYEKLSAALLSKEDEKAKKGIADKIKKLANNATPIMHEVKEMLVKWEAKDPEVYALWEKMNGWVYDGFEKTYQAMQVSFDTLYYESNTFLTGKELVEEGLEKGVFFKKEDGSVWIDLTSEGLDEKLVLRGDGTAVYVTQDIGTAQQRMNDYPDLGGIVYTVGNEQDYHFEVLFLILKKLGYKWADNCFHLSYGMIDLRNDKGEVGKMKSREGTVVDADDLVAEVVQKAKNMATERGHIEGMSEVEKEELFKMIGLGGLKYYLLKVAPGKRMTFNPEESVDLNGNTGPFIQYVHARISSLLRKSGEIKPLDANATLFPIESEIIQQLAQYPEIVRTAGAEYSPAVIANYVYELAKSYNSFFQNISVNREENDALKNMRLHLSQNVGKTIKSAMYLLGIGVPERM